MITGKFPSLRLRRSRKNNWSRRLIEENKNKAAYSVNVDAYDNKRYNLTWLLEKASVSKDCKNCWMTTAVTQPQFIGQLN